MISGGKSPKKILKSLSKRKLQWDKIRLFLTDERCVPNHHTYSNEKNIKDNLINYGLKKMIFFPLKYNKRMKINKIVKKNILNHILKTGLI